MDKLLRDNGFIISRRPKSGEVIWQLFGVEFSEGEALSVIGENALRAARYLEEIYWDEKSDCSNQRD